MYCKDSVKIRNIISNFVDKTNFFMINTTSFSITSEEKRRYARHIQLSEIGLAGQEKIRQANVLVIGCGALGSVVSMYLAGAGIGNLGIVDFDTVDISNLQRQLSYTTQDVGQKKTTILYDKIKNINPTVTVEAFDCLLKEEQANLLFSRYDFIIEGSDNPATKYMVADICREKNKPYCMGGVSQFQGQIMTCLPGTSGYRDLFPEGVSAGGFLPCSIAGVFGPLPGIVASVQASEALKYISEAGELLTDRLLLIDSLTMKFTTLKIK